MEHWRQSYVGSDVKPIFIFNQNTTSVQRWRLDVNLTLGFLTSTDFHFQPKYNVCPTLDIDVNLTLGSDVNPIFIFTKIQRLSNVGDWRQSYVGFWRQPDFHFQPKYNVFPTLEIDVIWRRVLTSNPFSFQPKYNVCPTLEIDVNLNVGLWRQPDFHFQPKYNVCPTLEIDVNLTLGSDVNPIFIFNQNTTSVQRWRLTSIWRRVLTSTRFSFSTKIQRLSNVGDWRQSDVGFWHQSDVGFWRQYDVGFCRQPDFHFQPKNNVSPTLGSSTHLTLYWRPVPAGLSLYILYMSLCTLIKKVKKGKTSVRWIFTANGQSNGLFHTADHFHPNTKGTILDMIFQCLISEEQSDRWLIWPVLGVTHYR